jgi:magnesium-transporting ATPase (P-type)
MVDAPKVVGLTSAEVVQRLDRDGPNVLPQMAGTPVWRVLLSQFVHFFAVMLWVAAGLALIAGLPEIAVAIAGVIVANALFAFVQEQRTEHAAEQLRRLLPQRVTVWRQGPPIVIDPAGLVAGDVVLVEAGDRVCADLQVRSGHGVLVDEAALTGESAVLPVVDGDPLWAGTFVAEGVAEAEVVATGSRTKLAEIAQLTTGVARPPTPLATELHRLVRAIAIVACSAGATFFALTFLLDTPPSQGVVFAIGITVALVPEGLLPTTTLSLAMGARRMASQRALVRRLESVETLGSTTMICTDKTGTLTTNRMSVVALWCPAGSLRLEPTGWEPSAVDLVDVPPDVVCGVRALASHAAGCASGSVVNEDGRWVPHGDPQEVALHVAAQRVGGADDHDATADLRFAFDPQRRRMSVVRGATLVVKGAPDSILPRCVDAGADVDAALEEMTASGLRVLAVASRDVTDDIHLADPDAFERNLSLVGLIGLEDPPRPGIADSIGACRTAGISVVMVTGDHPATALAIAREVGLVTSDELVMQERDLPDDLGELGALVDRDGAVIARVSPAGKLRIAKALRSRGHVVAMTGDGVNDGPALREADIGVAMGATGTDVAREAADLVLLDDNFATIVAAVAEGRATFANIRRFLTYHLTDNVAELTPFAVWALTGGQFPLALGVLQILVLDLATDTLPAVALGAEPPGPGVLNRPPTRGRLLSAGTARRAFGLLGPTEAFMAMTAFTVSLWSSGWRPGPVDLPPADIAAASGAAFTAVVLGQAANAFACRSTRRVVWSVGAVNRFVPVAVVVAVALGALAIGVPPIAGALGQGIPTLAGAAVAALTPLVVIGVDSADKWWRGRSGATHAAGDRRRRHRD